ATAQGRPLTGREHEAVDSAFTIARLLNDRTRMGLYGALLAKSHRVSFEYVRAVCRGDAPAEHELAERLRKDYPESFAARQMAAVVEHITGAGFERIKQAV